MSDYQVLFSGVIAQGGDQSAVEHALGRELGIPPDKVQRLFTGRTVVLASQLSRDAALAMQQRFEKLDAICRIKNAAPKSAQPMDWERERADVTLRDLTAAHIDCPRCGQMQLESSHCTRCGVDLEAIARKKRKEDLLLQKRLRDHRAARQAPVQGRAEIDAAADAEVVSEEVVSEELESEHAAVTPGIFSRLFRRSA